MNVHFKQETMPIEFNHSFMQIVTESDDTETFFTEKTATPMFLNKPFLVASNRGFHRDLANSGFKLYDELFDYSFDDEPDMEIRYEKIAENVKRYIGLSSEQLRVHYDKISDKIAHNRKLAIEYALTVPKDVLNLYSSISENITEYTGPLNNIKHIGEGFMKKIAMIGVGKLGQDCAEVMAEAGNNVVGYDIEPRTPAFLMVPYMPI